MSEFLNYKVDLTLHDGSKSSGVITSVDNQQIVLSNAYQTTNPTHQLSNLKISSSQIADLKVVQLPPDMLKNGKNKRSNAKSNGHQGDAAIGSSPALLDDAIVFAKSSTPTSRDSSYKEKNTHITPKSSITNSRSNTPRLKSNRAQQSASSTMTGDPDWGHEREIQDIKHSNEFDFAANLAMFDKKSVFADFQKNDSVNPEDRLVGHNKLETNQNKNKKDKYDNDEMILDVNKTDNWDLIGSTFNSKGKGAIDNIKSAPSNAHGDKEKSTVSNMNKTFKLVNSQNLSVIPLCSPVQLLEIERLSTDSYGVSPSIMAELCASNLSQLITTNILGGSTRLSKKKNHNLPPLVLLLIGSGRCGSRAFATGRHLTNHGVRVLAFVISNDDIDKELSTQWSLFEKCGGKVITSSCSALINTINHELDTPVELIIDALQGYDDHLEDIFYQEEQQKELARLMSWCNEPQQECKIMSLDIPSGIDGGSGTVLDPALKLNCKWCVSMGLPITGLIHAYKNGHLAYDGDGESLHYLVDVGIPNKVYSSKGNLRKFDKFWFSAEYSIKLDVSTE
ncbi:uncharacterized protein AC631_02132 [Debaryomyces fabryi]|uniref:Enhancer of mRNA-decapping protein 3 n=1 Tax=Debaryomyces fabryi TaxID=58627 RepID=A0A0V1Q0S4_9ASCO|nr:uncharacterized protein AC631_02132 [Debaryomyces fabryi]KSA02136.1 hypothetical protein AC631_02132 [Debaryomyces fabryi]CUM55358.1 unnamed protein product [Debaryomyces fabryi]